MKKLYLIRYGEIGTKGNNRNIFEDRLIGNIRQTLNQADGEVKVYRTYGRIFIDTDIKESIVFDKLSKVAGIVGICPALRVELDLEDIKAAAIKLTRDKLADENSTISFKINARRPNKDFELTSPEINQLLGAHVLRTIEDGLLEVDVHNPDLELRVEIRSSYAYLYGKDVAGIKGLPVGVTGKAGLLLSGGIDSPVAGYKMLKRGLKLEAIYFHSFPFTSDRAKEKVKDLTKVLAKYQGEINLNIVSFTKIQKAIKEDCPKDLTTIIMRRKMIEIAERLLKRYNAKALITGESLGQVASQTLSSIQVTDVVSKLPIFRPLIGIDKEETIKIAKDIGSYETSIQPYEDCCTIFLPETPETHPNLCQIEAGEKDLEIESLIKEAIESVEKIKIKAE